MPHWLLRNNRMPRYLIFCVLFFIYSDVIAQDESQTNNLISNIIEDFLESTVEENFDYNTIFENLNH